MKHGRKFFVTMAGLLAVVALGGWAVSHAQPEPSASVGAIALLVGAFCGSNAWDETSKRKPAGDA
jgi:hypothetical protein